MCEAGCVNTPGSYTCVSDTRDCADHQLETETGECEDRCGEGEQWRGGQCVLECAPGKYLTVIGSHITMLISDWLTQDTVLRIVSVCSSVRRGQWRGVVSVSQSVMLTRALVTGRATCRVTGSCVSVRRIIVETGASVGQDTDITETRVLTLMSVMSWSLALKCATTLR